MANITNGLCAHCSMVANQCNIDNTMVPIFVSRVSNLETGQQKIAFSEISSLFANALNDSLDCGVKEYRHLAFQENSKGVVVRGPHHEYVPTYLPKDRFLSALVCLDGSSAVTHFAWASMMKLKTVIPPRSGRITRSELDDHYHSIVDPFDGDVEVVNSLRPYIKGIVRDLVFMSRLDNFESDKVDRPLVLIPASNKARTVSKFDRKGNVYHKTVPTVEAEALNIRIQLGSREIRKLYDSDPTRFTRRLFIGMPVKEASFGIDKYSLSEEMDVPLSTIRFIPKPGCKERVVAVPAEIMQSLSYGIGQTIKKLNSNWRVQGVDSHDECTAFLSSKIKELNGSEIFDSADQSNFTDRLPYDLVSRAILEQLVNQNVLSPFDLNVCDVVCHGPVIFPDKKGYITRYGVGTPMGTYPSFPICSLTNGIIYVAAYMKVNGIPPNTILKPRVLNSIPCRVIGDDIVSWNHDVFLEYARLMNGIGCHIQPSKCLSSNIFAEACSKLITSEHVFEQKKIDSLLNAHDLPGYAHQYIYYGEPYLEFVSDNVVSNLRYLKKIPHPMGIGPSLNDSYWDRYPTYKRLWLNLIEGKRYDRIISPNKADYLTVALRSGVAVPNDLSFELDDNDLTYTNDYPPLVRSLVMDIQSFRELVLTSTDIATIASSADAMAMAVNTLRRVEDHLSRANPSYVRYADRLRKQHLKHEMPGDDHDYNPQREVEEVGSGLKAYINEMEDFDGQEY